MKNEKNYMCFHIPKLWQILKRFAGTFRRAQTLKLRGVISQKNILLSIFQDIQR